MWCLCLQEGAEEEKGCFSRAVRLRVCRESKDPWSQFQVVFLVRRSHCDPLVHSPSPSCFFRAQSRVEGSLGKLFSQAALLLRQG